MSTSPSPSATTSASKEIIDKLNLAVAGENAAVWAFGYLLSFIPDENKNYAFSIFNLHRNNRDKLRLRLRDLGITPPDQKKIMNYQLW